MFFFFKLSYCFCIFSVRIFFALFNAPTLHYIFPLILSFSVLLLNFIFIFFFDQTQFDFSLARWHSTKYILLVLSELQGADKIKISHRIDLFDCIFNYTKKKLLNRFMFNCWIELHFSFVCIKWQQEREKLPRDCRFTHLKHFTVETNVQSFLRLDLVKVLCASVDGKIIAAY